MAPTHPTGAMLDSGTLTALSAELVSLKMIDEDEVVDPLEDFENGAPPHPRHGGAGAHSALSIHSGSSLRLLKHVPGVTPAATPTHTHTMTHSDTFPNTHGPEADDDKSDDDDGGDVTDADVAAAAMSFIFPMTGSGSSRSLPAGSRTRLVVTPLGHHGTEEVRSNTVTPIGGSILPIVHKTDYSISSVVINNPPEGSHDSQAARDSGSSIVIGGGRPAASSASSSSSSSGTEEDDSDFKEVDTIL